MKKALTPILAIVAVVAIIFCFVLNGQKGTVQKALDEATAKVTEAEAAVADTAAQLEDAKKAAEDAAAQVAEATAAKDEVQKALDEATAAKDEVQKALDAATAEKDELQKALDEANAAKTEVQKTLEGAKTQIDDLIKQVEDAAANAKEAAAGTLASAAAAAGEAVDSAKEAVAGLVENVSDKAGEAVDSAKEAVAGVVENATEAAGEAVGGAKEAVEGAVENATEAAGEAVDGAKEAVEGAVENVTEAAGEAVEGAKEAVEGAAETATEAVAAAAGALEGAKVMTHEEFMAAQDDDEIVIEAYVMDHQSWWDNKVSVYLAAEDGAYFAYNMTCSEEDAAKLVPGTKIRVTGYKTSWAGEVEIAEGATFEFVEAEAWTATAADVTELLGTEELINHMNEAIVVKGATVVAREDGAAFSYKNPEEKTDDLYITVDVNGAQYEFCVEFYLRGKDSEVYQAVEALNVGDKVDIEGYLYWYNGPNPHVTGITAAQ